MAAEISWHGEALSLLPERAVFWARERALIIADPHFGKPAAFRHVGIPVPPGVTADDIARIESALAQTGAQRLIILGDFFHARSGRAESTLSVIVEWRKRHPGLEIDLVRGNHDLHAGDPPAEFDITCCREPLIIPPFAFCHHPESACREPLFCGHIHPAITLWERTGSRMRMACFLFEENRAVLPAFGSFTGKYDLAPRVEGRVFVVGSEVFEVPR